MPGKTITRAERLARRPIGLGTAIKTITAAIGIKPCGGCRRRSDSLDKMVPDINLFKLLK